MRSTLNSIACYIVAIATLWASPCLAQESKSLSDVVRGMQQLADSLATTRDQDGDNGPEFGLLANMFKESAGRIRDAYSGKLDTRLTSLTFEQGKALEQLLSLSRDAGTLNLRGVPTAKLNQLIYSVHLSVGKLFDSLPATDKPPALFGVQTRYFLQNTPYASDDLLLLGYHLIDTGQGSQQPDLIVSSTNRSFSVPASSVKATFSMIEVHLPSDQSRELGVGESPCSAPQAQVKLKIYYSQAVLWNLFTRSGVLELTGDILQPTTSYNIFLELQGRKNTHAVTQIPISIVSDQINVGCDESRSTSVSWTAPLGTVELGQFSAQWVNTNNLQAENAQVNMNGPNEVTAVGLVRGLEKQHFAFGIGNCPGGGHGALQLTGSYRSAVASVAPFVVNRTFPAKQGSNNFAVPNEDASAYTNIKVTVQRATCRVSSATLSGALSESQHLRISSPGSNLSVDFQPGRLQVLIP